ncbi:MAG: M28 family peptidase [Candidatus Thorarchaeota archaeon]
MNDERIIQQVDIERIYRHVLNLEGPCYPLDNMTELNKAATYIYNELESYGLKVGFQEFKVSGLDDTFKNVLGYIGDQNSPATLIGSHYDTVPNCPRANDNFSAVAISLEVAQIMAQLERPPSIIIASFTLEEGHPGLMKQLRDLGLKYGIFDSQWRYSTAQIHQIMREFGKLRIKYFRTRKNVGEAVQTVIEQNKEQLSKSNLDYLKALQDLYSDLDPLKSVEQRGLMGSNHFVDSLSPESQPIKGVINFDTVGWIRDEPKTHRLPPIPPDFYTSYRVDLENEIGNFIYILCDKNSNSLLDKFLEECELKEIDMPYLGIKVPMDYEQINQQVPDLLRMDHAPFWRHNIPAIAMSDGANFRTDIYHTPADTSRFMDFKTLEKLAKATIATLLDF